MTIGGNRARPLFRHMAMRILLLSLLLAACTYPGVESIPIDAPDLSQVSESYPCGYGFQAGSPDQTVGIFLYPSDFPRTPEEAAIAEIDLPNEDWVAVVAQGSDLFSNWCDDVMEPGEPTPYRAAEHTIVAGHLSITSAEGPFDCGGVPVTAELTDLVIEVDGERVELGDITITNDGWGCFAG